MASNGSCLHGHLDYFQKLSLGGRPNTIKPWDYGTPNTHTCWFILFYHVWGHIWIWIHWNSIWLKARSHPASCYTWGSMTTLHDFGGGLGTAFGHFLLGISQFHGCGSWLVCEVALRWVAILQSTFFCPLIYCHSHLLVPPTSEGFLPVGAAFRVDVASESHCLQPVLVLTVHWWPAPISVGGLLLSELGRTNFLQRPMRFVDITGQYPSIPKSN